MIENPQYIGLAIGIGMCLSLMLTETLGVTAGGVIVPGYIALFLDEPFKIIVTFSISILVVLIIKVLSNFMFIYGKRRLVLSLMLGFIFGYFSKLYLDPNKFLFMGSFDLSSIGNIIPGLIASWMDRQGTLKTISVIMIIAVACRLILIIISGGLFNV
ncbi:poly-gamma-glutamate biosynthesis protein PgsC [Candidatus Marinimicrobia bacterium]|nr:poly-gamma-glutamate biosynthesis protein PgsC [Candidatus Neomarinimicrobiota bacterium]